MNMIGGINKNVKNLLGVSFFVKNVGFVVFLSVMGLVSIYVAQSGERKLLKIDALERKVKEKRWELSSLQREYMKLSSPSSLSKDLEGVVSFSKRGPRILKDKKTKS